MFVLVLNVIVAAFLLFHLMSAKSDDIKRGTNVVTKFVRDTASNFVYRQVAMIALFATVGCFILSLMTKYKFIGCLPTLAVCIYSFILQNQSTKNKERVVAARTVTRGTLEVAGAAGEAIGTVAGVAAGTAVGGAAGGAIGADLGKGLGKSMGGVTSKLAGSMTDVASTGVTEKDMSALNEAVDRQSQSLIENLNFKDPALFMQKAKALGMVNEGDSINDVASRVLKFASPTQMSALDATLSIEDKAMTIVSGNL